MTKERKRYKVVIECVWGSGVSLGEIKRKKFFVLLSKGEYLRGVALRLANGAEELPSLANDRAIVFRLKNDGSGYGEGFGIKYGINKGGTLRNLRWYESIQYNWSYDEILKLKRLGIIGGDVNHIIVEIPEGLGAAGGSGLEQFNDLVSCIELMITTIKGGLGLVQHIKTNNSVKRIRKNGFDNPRDIREVIEKKDSWTLKKIKKLLQMDTISVVVILVSLGYVEKGGHWIYDKHNSDSLKMRVKWLDSEKQYDERIKEKINLVLE